MNNVAERVVHFVRRHRTFFLLFVGGLAVLLINLLLLPLVLRIEANRRASAQAQSLSQSFAGEPISRKELFIEDEPDFVPPVLYYRAPLVSWNAEFAAQFWQKLDDKTIQDLKKNADDRIKTLLEAIP